jgi:CheY-like chemotaxis protein
MEAVGSLAGGVAHDFNNLLMVISSHTQLIRDHILEAQRVDRYIDNILSAIERASVLSKQLLAFGRKQVQDLQVLDLNVIVPEFARMLPGLLGSDVDVSVRTSAPDCLVYCDKGQIEQVIMNLVINARDAMPDGGTLTIETDRVELGREYFSTHSLDPKAGEYIMVAVTDTGIGMDSATQSRIFEPFFTTKEPGKGTGLGLSTVYGIVKQCGGYVWVCSEPGVGTTFKLYFPVAEVMPRTEPHSHGEDATEVGGDETVLVVEDEAALRPAISEFLECKGYKVMTAANAGEALQISSAYEGVIDLLITDVVMPGLGGIELAPQLTKSRPELRVVYMSGYAEQTAQPEAFAKPRFYIQKPFTLEALAAIARRALDYHEHPPALFSNSQ